MDLAALLSPSQFEAVTHTSSAVCILAGAGSGKTRVITHRIAYLIEEKNATPWSCLAVTFTNKAAGEMRRRVDQLVPGRGRKVVVGTFHGLGARMLRRYGNVLGLSPSFVIYDADDADRLLLRVLDTHNFARDLKRPMRSIIEGWQSEGFRPEQIPDLHWTHVQEQARAVYTTYVARLKESNATDFGGLLLGWRDLLNTPVGNEIRREIKHLLVDEYQDVNRVQAEIVINLAKSAKSVAVVGDDDQAIYGWRGASADNLKTFMKRAGSLQHSSLQHSGKTNVEDSTHEGTVSSGQESAAHLVRLEDNYRSTRAILDAANGIISHNSARLGKTLRPTGDNGRPVRVISARDDIAEARAVVSAIGEHARLGRSLDEVVVLYRANAVSRTFEDELRRASLPYRLVGGVRFYDRKEVKDVLATVRCALNPRSDIDTERMIGAVPRGIGKTSMDKVRLAAASRNAPLLDVMRNLPLLDVAGVPTRVAKKANALASSICALGERVRAGQDGAQAELSAKDAIAQAVKVSLVAERLEAESSLESEGRLENLSALLSAAAQFAIDAAVDDVDDNVHNFLEQAALLGGDEASEDKEGEKVTLMTLHAAKGLEFDVVFLVGLEEHGFPHARSISDDAPEEALQEERRLAYVGMTRARRQLYLSWAKRRMLFGQPKHRDPSRFFFEVPAACMDGDVPKQARSSRARFRSHSFEHDVLDQLDDGHERVVYDDVVPPSSSRIRRRAGKQDPAAKSPSQVQTGQRKTLSDEGDNGDEGVMVELDGDVQTLRRALNRVQQRVGGRKRRTVLVDHAPPPVESIETDSEPQTFDVPIDVPIAVPLDSAIGARRSLGTNARRETFRQSRSGTFGSNETAEHEVGGRVEHSTFGPGTIRELRGIGPRKSAMVRFDDGRARVVILRYLAAWTQSDEVRVVPIEDEGFEL